MSVQVNETGNLTFYAQGVNECGKGLKSDYLVVERKPVCVDVKVQGCDAVI